MGVVDAPGRLDSAPCREEVRSPAAGVVSEIAPRALGEAVVRLGGGRRRITDEIDPGVGFVVSVRPGDEVARGDLLGVVHARSPEDARWGATVLLESVSVGEAGTPPALRPLVSHRLGPL